MQISDKKAVTIHYTLKDEAGETLDTSRGRDPLSYLQGAGNIVSGLEKALDGKSAGETVRVKLAPEEAYGQRDEKEIRNVPLRRISTEGKLSPGARVRVQTADGFQLAVVQTIRGDYATVDLNHPLAGMQLDFEVEVMGVRDATAEELTHGHVHAPGGHHHG
jgi:FKBP-type peptidyl-prolyl cis-trans isomerase SlyD